MMFLGMGVHVVAAPIGVYNTSHVSFSIFVRLRIMYLKWKLCHIFRKDIETFCRDHIFYWGSTNHLRPFFVNFAHIWRLSHWAHDNCQLWMSHTLANLQCSYIIGHCHCHLIQQSGLLYDCSMDPLTTQKM